MERTYTWCTSNSRKFQISKQCVQSKTMIVVFLSIFFKKISEKIPMNDEHILL
jgi:hypothetical protein